MPPKRPFLALSVLGFALAAPLGCAAPCQKVKASHQSFADRQGAAEDPHLSLSIPFATVDRLVAAEVRRIKPIRVAMPPIAGVSTGSLSLRVETVRTRPAPPGRLGFAITVGLSQGKRRVMGFDIDAVVAPRIDPKEREVSIALHGKNIKSIKPRLGKGATKQLADFVWSQLPQAARMLTSKKQIEKLASGITGKLMQDAFRMFERELLDDLGEITRIELELPELPLARASVKTEPGYMVLDVFSTLPVARGLAEKKGRVEGVAPRLVQARVSGSTAAELGNYAIEVGEIPSRWNANGEPDDDGPLRPGLAWNDDGGKPLRLHLWRLDEDCAHVLLAATPQVSVEGNKLVLRTDDAKIERVEGPLKVRAGIWFSGLGRRSFAFVEETAADFRFEIAGEKLSARVRSASVSADELVLGLDLGKPTPRKRRP